MGAQAGALAVQSLTALADDSSEWVRRNVAEALGTIGEGVANHAGASTEHIVSTLCHLLKDQDGQTRYEAAYALARLGERALDAMPALAEALGDTDNRYVSGHSVMALQRIGTPQAQAVLIDHLSSARWCSMTNKDSTF
jgi:HEAT repeat protein